LACPAMRSSAVRMLVSRWDDTLLANGIPRQPKRATKTLAHPVDEQVVESLTQRLSPGRTNDSREMR
jgi:hypothetical protein